MAAPIGIFDSGAGGLTVAQSIRRLLPDADLIYACDTAHFPYGPRPAAEVCGFFAPFATWFAEQGCGLIVVACNTATAALEAGGVEGPVPLLGVVEAGVAATLATPGDGPIGVIATQGTVASSVYPRGLAAAGVPVLQEACGPLVALVEAGEVRGPRARAEVERCLGPLLAAGVDRLVLGCTHFPHLLPLLRQVAGPAVTLIDPAEEVARRVASLGDWAATGQLTFHTTGDPHRFAVVLERLWPGQADAVQHLPLWGAYLR